MTTLRYKRNGLILSIALLIFLLLMMAYLIAGPLFSLRESFEWGILLFFMIPVLVCMAMVYDIVFRWSYRVEFGDAFVEAHAHLPPITQRVKFKCAYVDIVAVRKIVPKIIEIVPRAGQTFLVPDALDGGNGAVFNLLSQHIPPERFEPEKSNNLTYMFSRFDKVLYGIMLLALFGQLSLGLFRGSYSIIPLPLAWNYFGEWKLFSVSDIRGFSVESSDSVWVVNRDLSDRAIVEHIIEAQTKTWYLPSGSGSSVDFFKERVLADSRQQPVLAALYGVYFLKDGEWQKANYPAGYSTNLFRRNRISVLANESWMVLYGDPNILIRIQADAPQPQVVTLIDPITQKPLDPQQVKTTPDGKVLLQAGNIIYLLRNGELQKQHYPMIITDQLTVEDFTLANDGTVYVLLASLSGADSLVEKIGVDGKQVFTQLPSHPHAEPGRENYYSLEVDARGRLWVAGGIPSFVRVMAPDWGGLAREIAEYNQYNSNYQNGLESNLQRTSDGRIWAAMYHLVWMDSNIDDLPPPLPDWLAWARQPETTLPVILVLSFLSLLLIVVIYRKFWRKFLFR